MPSVQHPDLAPIAASGDIIGGISEVHFTLDGSSQMHARLWKRSIWLGAVVVTSSVGAGVPYPDDWPKLAKSKTGVCSPISGRYEYYGETAKRPTPFSTINIDNSGFNRMSIRGRPRTAVVAHAIESGEVVVTIDGDDLSPPERATFSRKTKCEDGWLSYVREAPGSRAEQRYAVAEDGSLIVHSLGMREHKPLFGQSDTLRGEWLYRFKKADAREK